MSANNKAEPPVPQAGSNSGGGEGRSDPRVRFLRACDRCRIRKIKCTNESPCARCVDAKATCSFSDAAILPSRTVLSSSERGDEPERPRKRRRAAHEPVPERRMCNMAAFPTLPPEKTAAFFMSRHGTHHAGSMSGLPLLEGTRQLESSSPSTASSAARAEPDWKWLQGLLGGAQASPQVTGGRGAPDDVEYFPGRDFAPDRSNDDLISSITQTIPHDLMLDLLRVFFTTVHPVWPIVHIPTFFTDLYRWEDHDFAALVVAMCMVASRYSSDPRVRSVADKPTSAGVHYYELFSRLRQEAGHGGSNPVYAIQSLFFASMFHCVDNVPHPVAHALFAEAQARLYDAGLHRALPKAVGDSVLQEVRSRTTFALYVWDKQVSAFCGRPHLSNLWDIDVRLPEPFESCDSWAAHEWTLGDSNCSGDGGDAACLAVFRQHILVSAVLECLFRAYSHRPIFESSPFLTELCRSTRYDPDGCNLLDRASAVLDKWRTEAPAEYAASPKDRAETDMYSVGSEQVALVEQTVRLLITSRHLQLDTMMPERHDKAKLERHCTTLINTARDLVAIVVQLGASSLLDKCDILIAYRLLLTGRILLAVVLSARSNGNAAQAEDATRILQATSVILRHYVLLFPAALGAAEVLDETIRVCRVPHTSSAPQSQFAWHRPVKDNVRGGSMSASPLSSRDRPLSARADAAEGRTGTGAEAGPSGLGAPADVAPAQPLPANGASPMTELLGDSLSSFFIVDATGREAPDLSWLLPGPGADNALPSPFASL